MISHHDVHRIIAHLLRDRDELDAILGEFADVELKLEVIANETREAMNDHDADDRWWRTHPAQRRFRRADSRGDIMLCLPRG
jgi:hypothetical protein